MKRFWIVGIALVASLATLAIALWLGSIGRETHDLVEHEARLEQALAKQPTAEALTRALAADGFPLLAAAVSAEDKQRAAGERGALRQAEIRAKASRYPELRVYQSGAMTYFIYFDQQGLMRDFTCVGR